MFTAAELEDFINRFATLAIDAHRDGAILEPTFTALDSMSTYGLNARWRRIERFMTDFDLIRPHLSRFGDVDPMLPPELVYSYDDAHSNIFSSVLTRRAKEIWQFGRRDQREADPAEIGSREWEKLRSDYLVRLDALLAPLEASMERDRERYFAERKASEEAAAAARAQLVRSRPASTPEPLPYGVSFHGAELLVAAWMRHIGILDAEVTPERQDGGVDVSSQTHLAQVKHYKGKVGVVEVREIFGVAAASRKQALFFTSTGYTAEAIRFGVATETPLFTYSAELGTLVGVTDQARQMV